MAGEDTLMIKISEIPNEKIWEWATAEPFFPASQAFFMYGDLFSREKVFTRDEVMAEFNRRGFQNPDE